jgi:mRNA interferase RelE/StbE
MPYLVEIKRAAEKELDRLPEQIRARILAKLLSLEEEPRPRGVKRLWGEDSYRLRIGDYRVLYTVDDDSQAVTIYAVGHRREVYRRV